MKKPFLVAFQCYELSKKQTEVILGSGQGSSVTTFYGQLGTSNQFPG